MAGVCLFILILWWTGKRRSFHGPKVEIKGLEVVDVENAGSAETSKNKACTRETSILVPSSQ